MSWTSLITSNNMMYIILAIIVLIVAIFLWRLNKDNTSTILLTDLVTDNGRLHERKFSRFGAWVVSTWGFVYLIVDGKLTEWYFLGYMGSWVANALIGKAIAARTPTKLPVTIDPEL